MKKSFVAGLASQLLAALLVVWCAAVATTAVADSQPNSDASQGSKSEDLAEILVTAKRHEETATKFDMPIIDVPQSIKVVTSDVLDFASVRDFNDLTKVDAATATQGVYGGVPQITIRGFTNSSNNGIKVDGIPELNAVPIDLGVFDHIEILKGPTSTLYGQNAVAGLINAVSKQPLSTFSGSVQAQVGSFSYSRFQADVGGPMTSDGKLSYRLYGALENGGTFVDYEKNKSAVVFAALKYNFDDATSVTETVDYQKRRYTPEYGIAVQEGSLTVPDVPVSRLYDVPWTYRDTTYLLERTVLTHNFSSNWKLRALAEFDDATDIGTDGYSFGLINASGVSDFGGPAQLNGDWLAELQRQWSFEADLTGSFDLFGHSQMVFIGADHHFTEDDWNDACSSTLGFLNIYAPNYAALSAPRPNLSDWAQDYQQCQANNYPASSVDTLTTESGVTTQLLLHPVDRLSVMLGTRWDRTTVLSNTWVDVIAGDAFQKTGAAMPTLIDSEKWVSQAGLTYEVHPNIAVYATWGQAFTPQIGTIYPDTPIPPEQGFQYEAGVKGNFGDLTATVDVYDMQRTHIEGVNFEYSNYVVDSGTEESKGVEADIFGIILPGWSIYGSFASVDGKITETDQAHLVNIGARMQGVPKFGESLYSFYELQAGPLKGLSFGGGVVSKQDIVWGLPSVPILGRQVDAGGYTTFDARVSYSYQRLMFDLKANNVFDEKYYTSFAPALRTSILPGRPREFIFSVKYKL